jgi:predicted RNA-binding Zn ribbon-like protein
MSESLAVGFANTRYAERGEPREAIATVRELRAWLATRDLPTRVTARDVESFHALRETVRRLLDAAVNAMALPSADVAALNQAAARAPTWPELVVTTRGAERHDRCEADPADAALAALARSTAEMVAGPGRERLRACRAPGCVMFFEQTSRRRSWCSAGCGNRARVARHYERTRAGS